MSFVKSYGCTSAAGIGVESLWNAVRGGRDCSRPVPIANWPIEPSFSPRACLWTDHGSDASASDKLVRELLRAWREARENLPPRFQNFGVILASTKGVVEDHVWGAAEDSESQDFIAPLLSRFLKEAELNPEISVVVSNACSSSISALWLAESWLERGDVDHVVILAADLVGPFVLQGFQCLHALSATTVRPFAGNRDGLQLGEAAACVVLSRESVSDLILEGAAIDAEGYAVTRPSPSGESLERAIAQLKCPEPDLIIAHGTGTELNDQTEDRVFSKLFPRAAVTASKWCIGHTLAASGLVDVILACEAVRRAQAFSISNTEAADPSFSTRYLTSGAPLGIFPRRVLVTSLGFGGIHAAASVSRRWA